MQFRIIKSLIIILSITSLTSQSYLYSQTTAQKIDDYGIISLMYHRFEENKYPSTNIKINEFKKHLEIIKENNITFVNPKNFENALRNGKTQRKILLTIDDGFSSAAAVSLVARRLIMGAGGVWNDGDAASAQGKGLSA